MDDDIELGDALQWLAFLVPWCAFALYAHVALVQRLGLVGLVEASCVSVASLPFWRAACRRPAFQPLAALLVRFHAKRNLRPFESSSLASSQNDGRTGTDDWRVAFEKRVPDAQHELAAFINKHANAPTSSPDKRFPTSGRNARSTPDDDFSTGRRLPMKTSNDDGSSFIVRDPATRLAAAGLEVFPLCDETLRRPNAAAARHFPATCAAVRAAGGFGARLWVLSPDTKVSRAHREVGFSRGVSDGYWRAHVVLDADEAETDTTFSFAEQTTLGDFAGIRAGDETRRAEIGDLIVVNDAFEKRWFHENKKAHASVSGANASDALETKSERRARDAATKKTSRDRK